MKAGASLERRAIVLMSFHAISAAPGQPISAQASAATGRAGQLAPRRRRRHHQCTQTPVRKS